jgi:hypothetical protein
MGNILKCFISCFDGEDEDGGSGHGRFPNSYPPVSSLHYQPLHLDDLQEPLSPPPPSTRQQQPPPRPALSRLHYQPIRLADLQVPLSPPPPSTRQQQLPPRPARPLGDHHGVLWPTIEITPCDEFLNLEFTTKVI